ncbi:ABC transporter substrate-binding protein [Chelativorans sp. AA-79]|uniref:ABC transporter substrate-binding protein n=1 Tax=Chelativorans sp. AA-79 TaxID=3028735 RepID=UPI0023F6A74A|nr:ABC transporter substrate-binding protein [Chelativorans sp. AA-79]WEX09132.1 ABC transporter substrate-binding protein [Chelativorans sp. AA-79]
MISFHISATGHSLNYLPEYVAVWQGYFEEEGLKVTADVPRPWDLVLTALREGTAQAALGGIWVPSMYLGRSTRFTPFAQVAARAPLAIVGREDPVAFRWDTLPGKVVLMKGSNGASVGLFFKLCLREQGVDPQAARYIQDLDGAMLSELFSGGMGDYLVIDYPNALRMEADGRGQVVQALPVTGGNVPWSVYYAEGESDPDRRKVQSRFAAALNRAMQWVRGRDPEDYADFLAATFPGLPIEISIAAVRTYVAHGMWTTPRIDPEAYTRWQRGIADGHLVTAPIPYDRLIDPVPTSGWQ